MRILLSMLLVAGSIAACNQQSAQEYLASGDRFAEQGDWQSAIIEYKNSVRQAPEDLQARATLGKAYVEVGNADAAIKELGKALEFGHDRELLVLTLAKAFQLNGDFDRILEDIEVRDSYPPELQADLLAIRGLAWLARGDRKAALSALDKARDLGAEQTEVRLAWASLERANGNPETQRRWLEPLLNRDGGIADAWSQIGEIEQQANQLDAAEKAYTRSIELRSYGHIDSVRRALVRIAQGNTEGARQDLDKIKNAGGDWPVISHVEGVIAFRENRLDDAQSALQNMLARYPDYSPSQLVLAMTYHRKGLYSSALTQLETYLEQHPEEYQPRIMYADTLLRTGKIDQAVSSLRSLESDYPQDERVLSTLSRAYQSQNKMALAQDYLERALQVSPQAVNLRLQLGSLLISNPATVKRGQHELAFVLQREPENRQAYRLLYSSFLRSRDYTRARQLGAKAERLLPGDSLGANMVALTHLAEKDKEKALELLNKALAEFPLDRLTSDNLARIYLRDNDLDRAKSLYKDLLTKDNADISVLTQLARIAAQQGQQEESLEWLKKASDRNPDALSPRLLLASRFLQANRASESLQVLNAASDEQKNNSSYVMLQAQTKLALGETEHSIGMLSRLLSKNPEIAPAHFLLAQAYAREGSVGKTRESLANTLEIDPGHLSAHFALASMDLAEGKRDAFQNRVKMLEERYPNNDRVLLLIARLNSRDQDFDQAIEKLSSLAEENPGSGIIVELAINQWKAGNRADAISSLEFWSQEQPDDSRVQMLLAQYYLEDNQVEAARAIYENIESKVPNHPVVLNNMAWALKDIAPAEGIKYAKRALGIAPENPMILDTLGILYLLSGDTANALATLEEAAKKAPGELDIQINYARALVAVNKNDAAKSMLAKLLENANTEEQRRRIESELENI